jgi:DNA invertase Pin-like site-specific DNA recombinase
MGIKWFSAQGLELAGVYKDDGISGGKWNRPGFLQVLDKLKEGELIWSWSQNRLARDTEMFLWFMRRVKEKGGSVVIDKSKVNMDSAGGRLTHTVMAAADEFQRKETGEKVKRVFEHRKKEAEEKHERLNWGRSQVPAELVQAARALARENPRLSLRALRVLMPEYKLKSGATRRVSLGWLSAVVKITPGYVDSVQQ